MTYFQKMANQFLTLISTTVVTINLRYKPATSSTVNACDTRLIRVSHTPISRVSTRVHVQPRVQFDLTRA